MQAGDFTIVRLDFSLSGVEYFDQPVILGVTFYSLNSAISKTRERLLCYDAYHLHQLKTLPSDLLFTIMILILYVYKCLFRHPILHYCSENN